MQSVRKYMGSVRLRIDGEWQVLQIYLSVVWAVPQVGEGRLYCAVFQFLMLL
jgi:hypothetical protein